MTTKLELETFTGKSFQAWKDQAAKAGLVLRAPNGVDSGDYPSKIWSSLRHFRRNIAIARDHKKIITTMSRALVTDKDPNGPIKREVLWYSGYYRGTTHKGEPFDANFEIGKFWRPRIVKNGQITYNQRTGDPIGPENALAGQDTIYTIDCPKGKADRKKLIDSILGDNHPDNVLWYVRHLDRNNYEQSRDESFSYDEYVGKTIEELIDTSQRGSGAKSSPYYTDVMGGYE